MSSDRKIYLAVLASAAVALAVLVAMAGSASAAVTPAPAWGVTTAAAPTVLPQGIGRLGKYDVVVENVGAAESQGAVTIKDTLPNGLLIKGAAIHAEPEGASCNPVGETLECTTSSHVVPSGFVTLEILYEVTEAVTGLTNTTEVSGGGARTVTSHVSTRLAEHPNEKGPAGIAGFEFSETGASGEPMTQAGAHPFLSNVSLLLNNTYIEGLEEKQVNPIEAVKDLVFYLPLGVLGNATVTEPCPESIIETEQNKSGCPPSSRIGSIVPMVLNTARAITEDPTHAQPIYSVTPEKGFPAEFAFTANNYTFVTYASVVRHDGSYVLRLSIPGVPPVGRLIGFVASFYGDIQEHFMREGEEVTYDRGAFLTDPSDCGETLEQGEASVALNTWQNPDPKLSITESAQAFAKITGCDLLSFGTNLSVAPDTVNAGAPAGYDVGLEVPQAPNNGAGLATPPVKGVNLAFPEDTTISPTAADGLEACPETGPDGIDIIEGAESEEPGPDGLPRPAPGHCPASSEVASVKANTPLLREELSGHVFLATPQCGGEAQEACTPQDAEDGRLFGLYLELTSPNSGIVIKLKGETSVQPGTGRITAKFDENPQLPFSKLTVQTKSGPNAALANPQRCGTATSSAIVEPWSAPETPSVTSASSFTVGQGGGECSGQLPFAPALSGGPASRAAGSTSPFSVALTREDGEQDVKGLSLTMPKGLLANVSSVGQCPEPQASQDSLSACPASSQIGTITAAVGSGPDPYYVTGKVFFTGSYEGAPFGLSLVIPAVAGPFNLGDVLVRAKITVNPITAQAGVETIGTVLPDGQKVSSLPTELDGVPLHLRLADTQITDGGFMLNATGCGLQSISGTVTSTEGAQASVSTPYAASGCDNLQFTPKFTATTAAKTSKADGASLVVRVTDTPGQANIAKVDVQLPKQLPARLTTLQKACTEAQFAANPAGCPEASVIGTATVHTPILNTPLAGPAYLVSHGGAAFPDVEFVLQGENGLQIVLDGGTRIKKGITYSHFETVPDAPISSFETVLPEGPHSVLATDIPAKDKGDMCGLSLSMPTTITGQNGAVISQTTKVAVTGCPRTKSLTRAQKLAAALKACGKDKSRAKRAECKAQAHKQYGLVKTKKKEGGKKK